MKRILILLALCGCSQAKPQEPREQPQAGWYWREGPMYGPKAGGVKQDPPWPTEADQIPPIKQVPKECQRAGK
jgi:hypothetical protein